MLQIVLGFGANLGNPPAAFAAALSGLSEECDIVQVSRLWRTRPVGPAQPDFVNAAVLIGWPEGPCRLLRVCRELEVSAGRTKETEDRWGPRPLDLDLLIARDLVVRGPLLELPHPRFLERAFALVPAAEVVPDWVHPLVGRTIGALADELRANDPGALISRDDWEFRRRT